MNLYIAYTLIYIIYIIKGKNLLSSPQEILKSCLFFSAIAIKALKDEKLNSCIAYSFVNSGF